MHWRVALLPGCVGVLLATLLAAAGTALATAGCCDGGAVLGCYTPSASASPCPTAYALCQTCACLATGPTWTPAATATSTATQTATNTATQTATQTATATATALAHTNFYASAVAAYNMETGALGTDSAGANTMTVTGGVSASALHQQGSNSGLFNGSTGVLECASGSCAPLHIAGGAFSTIGWFYFPSSATGTIAQWGLHFGAESWRLNISGGPHFEGLIENASFSLKTIDSTTTIGTSTWYHVGFVYDGADLYMYVDGVSDATPVAQTGNIYNGTARVTLGGAYDLASAGTLSEQFNGQEDELLIFNTALTAKQVCEACRFGADGQHADRAATCGTCTWQ